MAIDISLITSTLNATVSTLGVLAIVGMFVAIYHQLRQQLEQHNLVHPETDTDQAWLEGILSSIGDAVITTDITGSIMLLNPVAETLTGWPEQEAKHRSIQDIYKTVNTLTGELNLCPVTTTLHSGTIRCLTREIGLQHRDGSVIPIQERCVPILNQTGTVQGSVVIFRSVMSCKQTESDLERLLSKEKELSDLKSSFISMVSHDIRTPLTIILSSTDLLQYHADKVTVEKKEQYFYQIRTAVQRLQELLDDVLLVK